ncbi:hypothetical protein F2P56_018834 [Juglans regia]|uniref:Uncharacterized protein LOC108979580 n=2 Tax=Juglans regia TaxID=51240 RepID=A0A2I4DFA1_JUGRE|nr:uncharacterized protein LOC108979580 [Juglans regia]KAF5462864.1 hypothetical protein F2P56_018834 [Juglans regia]
MCPICLTHPETTSHVLWTCKAAQDVWSNSSRRSQKSRTEEAPFYELLTELLSTLPIEEHTKLALIAKELWYRRNKFIFESRFTSPQQVLKLVSTSISNLDELERHQLKITPKSQSLAKWCKPPTNSYKINWDAAIDKVNCKVGIDVSIRDWNGLVTATLRSPCYYFRDPLMGEALSALRAVQFDIKIELNNVIFKGDSKQVINGINVSIENWSIAG